MRSFLLVANVLLLTSCIDTISLDNAACPCLEGYYCLDGACRPNEDVVLPLEGKTYVVETTAEDWVEPSGFAEIFNDAHGFDGVYPVFAFEMLDVDPLAMTFRVLLGILRDGIQDKGLVTYEMTGTLKIVNKSRISFRLDPEDVQSILFSPVSEEGTRSTTLAWYYGLTLTGVFTKHGAQVEEGRLSTVMNADETFTLFYIADYKDGDEFCDSLTALPDVQCEACPKPPHDPICLSFTAEHLAYAAVPTLTLERVYAFDAKYD